MNGVGKSNIMVYEQYNLTDDEIKIIDPEFEMSEGDYENFKIKEE